MDESTSSVDGGPDSERSAMVDGDEEPGTDLQQNGETWEIPDSLDPAQEVVGGCACSNGAAWENILLLMILACWWIMARTSSKGRSRSRE
jgi:hypothetical protein